MSPYRYCLLLVAITLALAACAIGPDTPSADQGSSSELTSAPTLEPNPTMMNLPTSPSTPETPPASSVSVTTLVEKLEAATGGLTIDPSGNLYVADIGNIPSRDGNTVYKITPAGEVSVLAQGEALLGASGNAVDSKGNLFQANFSGDDIVKISPEGEITPFATEGISGPVGIAIDPDDNLYVANCKGASIVKLSPDGDTTQIARGSPFNCPNGITLDDRGNVYVANFSDSWIIKITPDGQADRFAELPGHNNGHIVFHGGTFYATGRGVHQIFAISMQGEVSLLAGTGERGWEDGPALEATFSLPNGIAINADGTALYINQVRQSSGSANYPTTVRVILLGNSE
jgi:sugar lactone lactonase YvrE